jgi:hypothetical protein
MPLDHLNMLLNFFLATIKALDFSGRCGRQDQLDNIDIIPSTLGWVWNSGFASWVKSSSGQFFWISGKPGSGKSTLVNYISSPQTIMEKLPSGHKWQVVHYFFDFRAGDGLANSFHGFLRSLLHTLTKELPYFARRVGDDIGVSRDQNEPEDSVQNTKILRGSLESAVKGFPPGTLECPPSIRRRLG